MRNALILCVALAITSLASADWSSDPNVNTVVCNAPNDTVQPKVVPAPDGGVYVSWFDNRTGGYDVYAQRFDKDGNPLWTANGIQIANLSFSSTQDYGACPDGQGGLVLAFQDDRFGGVKATVTRVDPSGVQVWGDNGKQVSNGGSVGKPNVSLSGDGRIVVGWVKDNETDLQRLELDGTIVWANPVVLAQAGFQVWLSDIKPGDGTSVIVSMMRQTGFPGAKTLRAQKVDARGSLLWGAAHVAVFTTGSLQFGNFPTFVSDTQGGALFTWYTTGPLQSWAQRINASGTVLWGMNGIAVTATSTRERTGPSIAFDPGPKHPAEQRTFVVWEEHIPNSSMYGVVAQAFDVSGNRLWGDNGLSLLPVANNFGVHDCEAEIFDGDPTFLFVRDTAFNNGTLFASRISKDAQTVWPDSPIAVSSTSSGHSRLDTLVAGFGQSLVAVWEDSRDGNQNLYGDGLRLNGTLGPPPNPDLDGDGIVGPADLAILLGAWGGRGDADLDLDGVVGASDLAILLGAWTS